MMKIGIPNQTLLLSRQRKTSVECVFLTLQLCSPSPLLPPCRFTQALCRAQTAAYSTFRISPSLQNQHPTLQAFPGGTVLKKLPANVGNTRGAGSIFGQGRNGSPRQYCYLENSMDGGAWQTTVQGVEHDRSTEYLCMHILNLSLFSQFIHFYYRSQR